MIPDIWSGLVWYRSITLLWYRSMYDERLGHVWNNSDTIWCVRTICMSPSRRALELVRAGGGGVARFGAAPTAPGGGGGYTKRSKLIG
jgi:hypothetical protein